MGVDDAGQDGPPVDIDLSDISRDREALSRPNGNNSVSRDGNQPISDGLSPSAVDHDAISDDKHASR
jgi:hypothetical protein